MMTIKNLIHVFPIYMQVWLSFLFAYGAPVCGPSGRWGVPLSVVQTVCTQKAPGKIMLIALEESTTNIEKQWRDREWVLTPKWLFLWMDNKTPLSHQASIKKHTLIGPIFFLCKSINSNANLFLSQNISDSIMNIMLTPTMRAKYHRWHANFNFSFLHAKFPIVS